MKRVVIVCDGTCSKKTLEALLKLEEFMKNYLSKYLSDLKSVGMHSILFNINKTKENEKLKNEHKAIYCLYKI